MTYVFPTTAGLERAKSDPNEPIYPGSIGSNRIFHFLRTTAGLNTSPCWNLYLINIYTLVRNAYSSLSKPITQKAVDKLIDEDVDLYMTFIGAYMSQRRATSAQVLFYAPNYRAIPKDLLRPVTGQRAEIDAIYAKLLTTLPTNLTEVTEDALVNKYLIATSGNTYPHKELPTIIRTIYGGQRSQGSIGTVLLSHCVMDLHVASRLPMIELLESFTAAVHPVAAFGRKLTQDVAVPFNPTTHRVFGDDVHLVPLCKGKQKTQLIKLAQERNWAVRTETEIITDITTTFPDITADELTRLRF
jgi:hypothetical protein